MMKKTHFSQEGIQILLSFLLIFTSLGALRAQLPSACLPSTWYNDDEYITNVTFNTINNSSTFSYSNTYLDYTSISTNVFQGSIYTLSVSMQTVYGDNMLIAYFDWNGNGVLNDPGEEYQLTMSSPSGNLNYTQNITVPNTSVTGPIRMRIFLSYDDYSTHGPCHNPDYGEIEDYTIIISPNTNCVAPVDGGTIIADSESCIGLSFNLNASGVTSGIGIDYQWQISNTGVGNWTDISGATSVISSVSQTVGNYYRLRTVCTLANDTAYSDIAFIDAVNCYLMGSTTSINGCSGVIFDSGGPNGPYDNYENFNLVITPNPGNYATLTFTEFDVEEDYDYLYIYDGTNIPANLIDDFSGSNAPTYIVATNDDGIISLRFTSDVLYVFNGFRAVIGCIPKPAEDIAIVSIDKPMKSSCSFGNDIELTIQNKGTDTLITAEFLINTGGISQNVSWTGSVPPFQSQQITLPGTYYFNDGDSLYIEASLPNGILDPTPANNFKGIRHYLALQGVYKIGYGVTNTDTIATIQLAIERLEQRGICGDVYFDIEPGTYTDRYVINQFYGWDSGNKVIFRSESQNANDVILQATATTSATNYVFRLNGADGIGFQHVTLKSGGTSYRSIIDITNGAHEFSADNCKFIGDSTITSLSNTNDLALIKSSGNTLDNASTITNNEFVGGSRAIYFNSVSSDFEKGHNISNNIFSKYFHYGVTLDKSLNPVISNNTFENKVSTNTSAVAAIYVSNNSSSGKIEANNIITRNPGSGIYINNVKGAANPFTVNNNFIYVVDTTSTSGVSGIRLENGNSNNILIANNSISIENKLATNAGVLITDGLDVTLLNNNIGSFKAAPAVRFDKVYSLTTSNNNNIYSAVGTHSTYAGTSYNDLAAWTLATNQDAASLSVNPGFNGTDLHTCVIDLNGAGAPIANLTVDIDGDVRGTNPDIGADEFLGDVNDLLVNNEYSICANSNVTIGNAAMNGVSYSWSSGETTSEITVNTAGQYIVTATTSCGIVSDTVLVDIKPAAVADFSIATEVGLAVSFDNNSTNALAYSWNFGDGNSSTEFEPTHIYSEGGNYVIQLTVYGECDTVTTTKVYNAIALSTEEVGTLGVKLFPNPATDNVTLTFDADLSNSSLKVYDVTGKVVYTTTIESSLNTIVLPVSNLNTGIYTIQINSKEVNHSLKFVKK